MEIKVKLNNLRVAPRKSRQVIDLIRGKSVAQARSLLEFTVKRTAEPVLKLLNSAVASAAHNHQLKDSDLYVATITVDEGPTMKRMNPESRGRGFPIMKRTSHITLILKEFHPVKSAEGGVLPKVKQFDRVNPTKKSTVKEKIKETKKIKPEKAVTKEVKKRTVKSKK